MTEIPQPPTKLKRRKPYVLGQVVRSTYGTPTGKIPEGSTWKPFKWRVDKKGVEEWQLTSTEPHVPSEEKLPSQRPPEVVRQERIDAQVEDWQKRTDI